MPPPPAGRRSALLERAIRRTGARRAKVCFVPTAVGDSQASLEAFYAAFRGATHAEPSHLQLFAQPNVPDVRSFLMSRDLIWVGGGSVVNLLPAVDRTVDVAGRRVTGSASAQGCGSPRCACGTPSTSSPGRPARSG
ncbi:MAG TPA: Type 1 glutamine amidotransferase-like domain-containing protein [Micromonosporaceae bacterium]